MHISIHNLLSLPTKIVVRIIPFKIEFKSSFHRLYEYHKEALSLFWKEPLCGIHQLFLVVVTHRFKWQKLL